MEIGDSVTIATGKHKDKSATVRKFTSLEVCCYVDNEFYFWFQPEELSKPMAQFQFPQTEALQAQIVQLQEQLKKYQDCEFNANQLKEQVAQQAKLMLELEVKQADIVNWANRLYFLATGIDLRTENTSATETLNQEIEGLKSSNKILRQEREQLEAKLNIYKQDTQEVDSYVRELQQLREENDKLQKLYEGQKAQKEQWEMDYYKIRNERDRLSAIEKNHPNQFQVGNTVKTEAGDVGEVTGFAYENVIVKLPSGEFQFSHNLLTKVEREYSTDLIARDIVRHEDGGVGTVTYVPEPFRGIVSVKMVNGNFNYHADKLTFISRPTPEAKTELTEAEAQAKASEFISEIKTKSTANEVTWTTIKEVCQKDVRVLREIGLAARLKIQKELVESIPELLAEHIKLSGDRSDLNWVGNVIKVKAEELLEQKRQAQIDSVLEAIPESELNLEIKEEPCLVQ